MSILGRGASNEYVDPGPYSVDNITTTKTIGIGGAASGFDFGTFLEAEAAVDTTAIVYDNNLAKRNLAVVFEAVAGTYVEAVATTESPRSSVVGFVVDDDGASEW